MKNSTPAERTDAEPIGGTAPGHNLTVGQVRAFAAVGGFRCSHVTEAGTICDACLPATAVNVALFPGRLFRRRGAAVMTRNEAATPGRPREGTAISTRLRDDQLAALDRLAAARSISRADVIRLVIDTGLRNAR